MVACVSHSSALPNLLGDLAREGVVESVDLTAGTARVRLGDLVTGDVPWLVSRAGKTRVASPPSIGEQVLVISPEGRTASAIIIGSLSSDANPHPTDDGSTTIAFDDGAVISYDPAAHSLTAYLPGDSFVEIRADDIYLRGNVHVEGQITATGDVQGAGKSLKDHVHLQVQPGQGVSGKPQ